MTPEESIARMREKRERRQRERERKRLKLMNVGSLEEYHAARYGEITTPAQTTSNIAYATIKRRA